MLILFFAGGAAPAAASYINMGNVLDDLWPALNASGPANAIFWTADELYAWCDEAAKRLGRMCGVFAERDESLTTAEAVPDYPLPARQIDTLQADIGGRVLFARNVQEVEALDADWPNTEGQPKAFLQDSEGLTTFRPYPIPDLASTALTIGLVIYETPADLSAANAILPAPTCFQDYFWFYALAEARSKESNASMDEVGDWLKAVMGMYEQLAANLWGKA